MINLWRGWRRKKLLTQFGQPSSIWLDALEGLPIAYGLSAAERLRLYQLSRLLLVEKKLTLIQMPAPKKYLLYHFAIQACLPILYRDINDFRQFKEFVLVPATFNRSHYMLDEIGLAHLWQQPFTTTPEREPVILSWHQVGLDGDWSGFNLTIHELAHKLDIAADGEENGLPLLNGALSQRVWQNAFTDAIFDLRERYHAVRKNGGEPPEIDRYASTDPAECFAVFSEYFFSAPETLSRLYPDVYRLMKIFYGQDPLERWLAFHEAQTLAANVAEDPEMSESVVAHSDAS